MISKIVSYRIPKEVVVTKSKLHPTQNKGEEEEMGHIIVYVLEGGTHKPRVLYHPNPDVLKEALPNLPSQRPEGTREFTLYDAYYHISEYMEGNLVWIRVAGKLQDNAEVTLAILLEQQ